MKQYIGSQEHFEDSVNGYYDQKEEESKQFDNREQLPAEPPSDNTQSIDMTAKEFFNGEGGALTLDFLNHDERDFLIHMIELYAAGKVKNALKDNTQIRDGWVRVEDMEKEYKRGFDDGVKYRDGQHKAYFTIES